MFGLPLTVIDTGTARLEHELEILLGAAAASAARDGTACGETGPGAAHPWPQTAVPGDAAGPARGAWPQTAAIAAEAAHEPSPSRQQNDLGPHIWPETAVMAAVSDHELGPNGDSRRPRCVAG